MGSVVYWKEHSSFQQISQIVSGLKVINDAAERLLQFDSDCNEILTKAYFRLYNKHAGLLLTQQTFSKNI